MRVISISTLCFLSLLFGLFGSKPCFTKNIDVDEPTEILAGVARLESSGSQMMSTKMSRTEMAAVDELLRGFLETMLMERDPEKAYRIFFSDSELSEGEKSLSPGWNGFYETALRNLSLETRAQAFAVGWRYNYSAVILAMGTCNDLSECRSSLELARRMVDSELEAIRARRHISEDEFYDALDFLYDDDPLIIGKKLNLMREIFNELSMELAKKHSSTIFKKNFEQMVRSRQIEKRLVGDEPMFVVHFAPDFWIVCSARGGNLRIVSLGDDY